MLYIYQTCLFALAPPALLQTQTHTHSYSPSTVGSSVSGGVHASRRGSVGRVLFWDDDFPDDLTWGGSDLPPQSRHLINIINGKTGECQRNKQTKEDWLHIVVKQDVSYSHTSSHNKKMKKMFSYALIIHLSLVESNVLYFYLVI